jgi:hypothetical protein
LTIAIIRRVPHVPHLPPDFFFESPGEHMSNKQDTPGTDPQAAHLNDHHKNALRAYFGLVRRLGEIQNRYTRGADRKTDLRAMALAVNAVVDFLLASDSRTAPVTSAVLMPLWDALCNRADGYRSPALDDLQLTSGDNMTKEHLELCLQAAECITAFHKVEKKTIDDAVRHVVREFRRAGKPVPRLSASTPSAANTDDEGRLKTWRRSLLRREDLRVLRARHDEDVAYAQKSYGDKAAAVLFGALVERLS